MRHAGTKILETNRLILRPFKKSDAQVMFDNWACDSDVTKFLTWKAHENVGVTKHLIKEWTAGYKKDDFYLWAIVPKETGEPIGSISVVSVTESVSMGAIGYCIGKHWWRQGITSEALTAVIDFLFSEVGFNRIEAHHDVNNPNSGKVMAKCGLEYEGTLRQYGLNNTGTGVCDICVYAVLAEDYKKNKI